MQQEDRAYDMADLHEEVLAFLLNIRKESSRELFFLLRSDKDAKDREALKGGQWFYGRDEYIDIYFTESQSRYHWQDNIDLSINKQGQWNFEIQITKEGEKNGMLEFAKDFMVSLGHFGRSNFKRYDASKVITARAFFEPRNSYYRDGLPEAIDIIDRLISEGVPEMPRWISPIDPKVFEERLTAINQLRKSKSSFSLAGLTIQHFHGIKDTSIQNLPENAPWIFLTGENGFGKTSLLQAIAMGLYGNTEDPIIPKNGSPVIEATYRGANVTRTYSHTNHIRQPRFFRPVDNLACYGPSRLQLQSQQSRNEEAKNATATYSLFNLDGILKNIEYELFASFYDNEAKFRMLEKLLKGVIPSLHKIELDKKERRILYIERSEDEDQAIYEPVGFDELASGIRSIIAMVGDIYLRLSDKMERQEIDKQTDAGYYQPEELGGIVIIDELDLHLHPKWQYELPGLLSAVFPKIQFIASTHSPIPLLGAPKDSVFLTVDRSKEEGITVKKQDVDVSNLNPNLILTSEIFGFYNIIAKSNVDPKQVRTEDTMQEKEFRDELKKRLLKFAEEEGDYPEDLFKK